MGFLCSLIWLAFSFPAMVYVLRVMHRKDMGGLASVLAFFYGWFLTGMIVIMVWVS